MYSAAGAVQEASTHPLCLLILLTACLPCLALAQALKTVATRVKNVADRVTESPVKTTSEVLAEICGCIREGKAAAKSSVSSIAPAPSSIAVKAVGKAKASDMRVVEMEEEGTLPPEA